MAAVYSIYTSPNHKPVPDHLPTLIVCPHGKPNQILYTYLHTNMNMENYLLTPSEEGDLCVAKLFPPASRSGNSAELTSPSRLRSRSASGSVSSHHSSNGGVSSQSPSSLNAVKCEASRNLRWSISNHGIQNPIYKLTLPTPDQPLQDQPLFQVSKPNPNASWWTLFYFTYAGHLIPPKRVEFGRIQKNSPESGGGTRVSITGKTDEEKAVWKTLGEGNEDMVEWVVLSSALTVVDDEIIAAAEALVGKDALRNGSTNIANGNRLPLPSSSNSSSSSLPLDPRPSRPQLSPSPASHPSGSSYDPRSRPQQQSNGLLQPTRPTITTSSSYNGLPGPASASASMGVRSASNERGAREREMESRLKSKSEGGHPSNGNGNGNGQSAAMDPRDPRYPAWQADQQRQRQYHAQQQQQSSSRPPPPPEQQRRPSNAPPLPMSTSAQQPRDHRYDAQPLPPSQSSSSSSAPRSYQQDPRQQPDSRQQQYRQPQEQDPRGAPRDLRTQLQQPGYSQQQPQQQQQQYPRQQHLPPNNKPLPSRGYEGANGGSSSAPVSKSYAPPSSRH